MKYPKCLYWSEKDENGEWFTYKPHWLEWLCVIMLWATIITFFIGAKP